MKFDISGILQEFVETFLFCLELESRRYFA
jgi:hypothetical protein